MATLNFTTLLQEAVNKPGTIMKAYSAFHNYSLGNQLLALVQCQLRGIEPGPINTFPKWQDLKRHVKKGEKALTLCMPVTVKRKERDETGEEQDASFTTFVYKPRWFVLAQTDGEAMELPQMPTWDADKALSALAIERIPFTQTDGNCQGYATKRSIAVSPIAQLPHKTLLHEMAHLCCLRSYVVLGGQVVWNEALPGSGLYITFSLDTCRVPPCTTLLSHETVMAAPIR